MRASGCAEVGATLRPGKPSSRPLQTHSCERVYEFDDAHYVVFANLLELSIEGKNSRRAVVLPNEKQCVASRYQRRIHRCRIVPATPRAFSFSCEAHIGDLRFVTNSIGHDTCRMWSAMPISPMEELALKKCWLGDVTS